MKAKSPLFNELRKGMGNLDIRTRKNGAIELGLKRIPTNPKTQAQREWRDIYNSAVAAWNALSPAEKAEYEQQGKAEGLPGYNVFMKEYLLNPPTGILYVISVYNPGSALSNFQVMLKVNGDSEFFSKIPNSTGLEIKKTDESTLLPFWIETWDATGKNATIWIKFDSIAASATTQAYIYYNKNRTEPLSSPSSVFEYFTHFEDGSGWTTVRSGYSGYPKYENSFLKLKSSSERTTVYKALSTSTHAIRTLVYCVSTPEAYAQGFCDTSFESWGLPRNAIMMTYMGWPSSSYRNRIEVLSGGSLVASAQSSQGYLYNNNFYILTSYWYPTTLKMYTDTTLVNTLNSSTYSSRSHISMFCYGDGSHVSEYWVDWLAVHKTCSQTLTVSYAKP